VGASGELPDELPLPHRSSPAWRASSVRSAESTSCECRWACDFVSLVPSAVATGRPRWTMSASGLSTMWGTVPTNSAVSTHFKHSLLAMASMTNYWRHCRGQNQILPRYGSHTGAALTPSATCPTSAAAAATFSPCSSAKRFPRGTYSQANQRRRWCTAIQGSVE
jgi:hypothetical protein